MLSHLTRGAWIEIYITYYWLKSVWSRTSHEVRGLKYDVSIAYYDLFGRTSHEVRGLKYVRVHLLQRDTVSHLTRGAWIEIENGV